MSRDTRHHIPPPRYYPPTDWDRVSRVMGWCAVVITVVILVVLYWPN